MVLAFINCDITNRTEGVETLVKLENLIKNATQYGIKTVAVAAAEDSEVIEAISEALKQKLASFYLYGDSAKINHLLQEKGVQYTGKELQVFQVENSVEAAHQAVKAVSSGEADVVMKGMVPTATILKAVLNKDYGLRTGNVLSHTAVFEVPDFEQLVLVTDAAMNIEPDLQQKVQIIQNAVQVAHSIGIEVPKVAPLAAVEVVNSSMTATLDAAALTQMNRRGQIKGCIVDGPLALDNAISKEAAAHKGIDGETAGQADILVVPDIEAGNILYKSLVYFAKAKVGAVISGAKAPIVLTSRADTAESKLYSLALAVCNASYKKTKVESPGRN